MSCFSYRKITNLYGKLQELVGMLAELLQLQLLTDTTVLHLSTLGVAPFFVENIPELQLSSLKLVTGMCLLKPFVALLGSVVNRPLKYKIIVFFYLKVATGLGI